MDGHPVRTPARRRMARGPHPRDPRPAPRRRQPARRDHRGAHAPLHPRRRLHLLRRPTPIREAIAAGAASVVSRGAANQDLIDAVRAALEGCPGAGHDWARAPERDESPAADGLSDQEVRVLALYAGGMKSSRVARTLGLSVPTVNTCIARIREKYRGTGRPTAGS